MGRDHEYFDYDLLREAILKLERERALKRAFEELQNGGPTGPRLERRY